MANIHNNKNKNIKIKARRILYTNNGSNINNNNVGNLIIEIAERINKGNNKNEIREALLKLGNFLKTQNKNLKERLSTKFGRYGTKKTTKITKKSLAIAIRLKQINEKNDRIGNINENNTEIGENNIKNNNNTLPTRAQLLYYIIIYVLKILNLKQISSHPPPTPESQPPSNQGNNNWGSNFNIHIINVIEAIEKFSKEKQGLVGKFRRTVENARMNKANDVEKIKKLLNEMVRKILVSNVNNKYLEIMEIFNRLSIEDQGSLWEFISDLKKKELHDSSPQLIKIKLKNLLNKSRNSLNKTSGQTTEKNKNNN